MKLAVISTTIHNEEGFLPFDRLASNSPFRDIAFFITGDRKTPPFDTSRFACRAEFLNVRAQGRFACSESIGWNKIMRRNIALLRAMEWKPDYILTIDDDNVPPPEYFEAWYRVLRTPANAIMENPDNSGRWFNYLRTTSAPIEIFPRGFPICFRGAFQGSLVLPPTPIQPSQIGLFQGISLGNCDVDAITHIVCPCTVESIREKNYCVRDLWSPYNTQNTILSPGLFPLGFVWPFCGRYDDIFSSFAWQQLLFNNGHYVHVGDAVNRQERGDRDLLRDLSNEAEGYLNAHLVWQAIRRIEATDPIGFLEALLACDQVIIQRQHGFMRSFLQDLKRI
jgi:hypothetical protein